MFDGIAGRDYLGFTGIGPPEGSHVRLTLMMQAARRALTLAVALAAVLAQLMAAAESLAEHSSSCIPTVRYEAMATRSNRPG